MPSDNLFAMVRSSTNHRLARAYGHRVHVWVYWGYYDLQSCLVVIAPLSWIGDLGRDVFYQAKVEATDWVGVYSWLIDHLDDLDHARTHIHAS
jgi:hypothetical protein